MKDPDLFDIKVVHCKVDHDSIYIARGSVLGNPFKMKDANDNLERDAVCDQYDNWFRDKVKNKDSEVMDELYRLTEIAYYQGGIHLGCFCAPRRCHGDTIKAFLEHYLNGVKYKPVRAVDHDK